MTKFPEMTKTQREAFDWLPPDGAEAMQSAGMMRKLYALKKTHPVLIQHDREWRVWRLSPAGVRLRMRSGA